ncbi:MAG TPA: hypothetical protein VMK65_03145 [Longimicrobiales bacterium]|nr:hypothetical protein [Longimicrobiales bacterium]
MSARAPWWLEGGTETCEACTHVYAYHIERRCYACDAPLCPFCVTTVRVDVGVVCSRCEEEQGDGPDGQPAGQGEPGGRPSSPEKGGR